MNTQSTTNGKSKARSNGHRHARIEARPLSKGQPAPKLLGVLPIARLIPQDIHSVMDYVDGLTVASGMLFDDNAAACTASIALGASAVATALMTDYRLSAMKLIPIRTHEVIDHVWGLSCIAAPFVFGYWKKAPRVAMTHVMTGAMTIVTSLLTDYRAYKARR
ncbi:MAG: hypothetical protein JO257_38240 [Deltaproteobacteria bacterium]|nr:hypothetical protein [Deltaproteobacteria bacterium]